MWNTTRCATIVALLFLVPACGDDSSDDDASDTTGSVGSDACSVSGEGESLTISERTFVPDEVSVAPGGSVSIENDDGTTHTFTSDEAGFDCEIAGGATLVQPITAAAGEYEFHCKIHASMTGTLIVG